MILEIIIPPLTAELLFNHHCRIVAEQSVQSKHIELRNQVFHTISRTTLAQRTRDGNVYHLFQPNPTNRNHLVLMNKIQELDRSRN